MWFSPLLSGGAQQQASGTGLFLRNVAVRYNNSGVDPGKPAGTQPTDILIAIYVAAGVQTVFAPAGWTSIPGATFSSEAGHVYAWWAPGYVSSTLFTDSAGGGAGPIVTIYAFAGADQVNPIRAAAVATSDTTTITAPSVNANARDALIHVWYDWQSVNNFGNAVPGTNVIDRVSIPFVIAGEFSHRTVQATVENLAATGATATQSRSCANFTGKRAITIAIAAQPVSPSGYRSIASVTGDNIQFITGIAPDDVQPSDTLVAVLSLYNNTTNVFGPPGWTRRWISGVYDNVLSVWTAPGYVSRSDLVWSWQTNQRVSLCIAAFSGRSEQITASGIYGNGADVSLPTFTSQSITAAENDTVMTVFYEKGRTTRLNTTPSELTVRANVISNGQDTTTLIATKDGLTAGPTTAYTLTDANIYSYRGALQILLHPKITFTTQSTTTAFNTSHNVTIAPPSQSQILVVWVRSGHTVSGLSDNLSGVYVADSVNATNSGFYRRTSGSIAGNITISWTTSSSDTCRFIAFYMNNVDKINPLDSASTGTTAFSTTATIPFNTTKNNSLILVNAQYNSGGDPTLTAISPAQSFEFSENNLSQFLYLDDTGLAGAKTLQGTWYGADNTPYIAVAYRSAVTTTPVVHTVKKPWNRQPQGAAQIDWSNPLTRGLVSASLPSFDVIKGRLNYINITEPRTRGTAAGRLFSGFNGTSAYVAYADQVSRVVPPFTVALSIFYDPGNYSAQALVAQGGASSGLGWSVRGGGLAIGLTFGNVEDYTLASNVLSATPRLCHICVTVSGNGGIARAYLDGRDVTNGGGVAVGTMLTPASTGTIIGAVDTGFGYGAYLQSGSSIGNIQIFNRALSANEVASLARNPHQIFKPHEQPFNTGFVVESITTAYQPNSDVTTTGWTATPGPAYYDMIDEQVASDVDYITSPNLNGSQGPIIMGINGILNPGYYYINVRAGYNNIDASMRVQLLDGTNAVVGESAWQALTSTQVTYQLPVLVATGTASRVRIDVIQSVTIPGSGAALGSSNAQGVGSSGTLESGSLYLDTSPLYLNSDILSLVDSQPGVALSLGSSTATGAGAYTLDGGVYLDNNLMYLDTDPIILTEIVPVLATSRITGTAPLAVHFDATATTSENVTDPFRQITYTFDYGDTGSGTWSTNGQSKNSDSGGPLGAHVYETPGTYTVTLTANDGTGSSSTTVTVTVADPDTVYAGTNTICIDPTGGTTGGPTGCQYVTSMPTIVSNRRYLIRRGQTISSFTVPSTVTGVRIGAYGTGAKPIITGQIFIGNGSTPTVAQWAEDVVISDLAGDSGATINQCGRNLMLLRCDFVNTSPTGRTAINCDGPAFSAQVQYNPGTDSWGSGDTNRVLARSDFYVPKYIFVVECYQRGNATVDTNLSGLYISVDCGALMGNDFRDADFHSHRLFFARKTLIQHSSLQHTSYANNVHTIKLHSGGTNAPQANVQNQPDGLAWYSELNVIRRNTLGASDSPNTWTVAIRPQNTGGEDPPLGQEGVQDTIVEDNSFIDSPSTSRDIIVGPARRTTTRGNTRNNGAIRIDQDNNLYPAPFQTEWRGPYFGQFASTVAPALTASRLTGAAPLAVHFDATATTSTVVADDFREVTYAFNYGDAGSGTWSTSGLSKNTDSGGPLGAHVYETPGTYTVNLTANDGTSSGTITAIITVTDPDVVYAGTNTICIDPSGGTTGGPAGCQYVTSMPTVQSNRRYLIKRGSTIAGFTIPNAATGVRIGAYGTGAKPNLTSALVFNNGSQPSTAKWVEDICVSDLNLQNGTTLIQSGRYITVLRCEVVNTTTPLDQYFYLGGETKFWATRTDQPPLISPSDYYTPQYVAVVECYQRGQFASRSGALVGMYGGFDKFTFMGNDFRGSPEHNVRLYLARLSLLQHNRLEDKTFDTGRHCIKLHAGGLQETWGPMGATFSPKSYQNIIRRNILGAADSICDWSVAVRPENRLPDGGDQGLEDTIVEDNSFINSATKTLDIVAGPAKKTTTRGNTRNDGAIRINQDTGTYPEPVQSSWRGPYYGQYTG